MRYGGANHDAITQTEDVFPFVRQSNLGCSSLPSKLISDYLFSRRTRDDLMTKAYSYKLDGGNTVDNLPDEFDECFYPGECFKGIVRYGVNQRA